jgi:hypothetical protein
VFEIPLSIHSASPAKSRGPSLPAQEPVIVGKAPQSSYKFERAAPWVPASAGTASAEVADFHLDRDTRPATPLHPPYESTGVRQPASLTRTYHEHT